MASLYSEKRVGLAAAGRGQHLEGLDGRRGLGGRVSGRNGALSFPGSHAIFGHHPGLRKTVIVHSDSPKPSRRRVHLDSSVYSSGKAIWYETGG